MASLDVTSARTARLQGMQPKSDRPKALICKSGPAEVLDICMMQFSEEADIEQVATLAEAMQRCLDGGVDILFVNLFSFTARELTALAAFRSLRPAQTVIAVAGPEMSNAFIGSDLVDEVRIVAGSNHAILHP
jgi:riboflavin biosynthesis pyrimidine reductase